MAVTTYKDLKVWAAGMDLSEQVYRATESYPRSEMFGMVSQMRRAAVSVPSNIAEGSSRQHTGELIQFLYIANGSLGELETLVLLSRRLQLLQDTQAESLVGAIREVGKMIGGLVSKLRGKAV
jgi:four helix bundle protein